MMTRSLFLFSALAAASASFAVAKPNFSGEWTVDVAKSDFGDMPAPGSMVMQIDHADPKIAVKQFQSGGPLGELKADLSFMTDGGETKNNVRGSAMVSSVGMLGLPRGFAPLAWMYDVPVLVLVGEITQQPVVVAGRVEVRDVLPITATIDHRYVDGWQIAKLMRAFRDYLATPQQFEPAIIVTAAPELDDDYA